MQLVRCIYENSYRNEYACDINDFPYHQLIAKTKGKEKYISLPATFDIETSTVPNNKETIEKGKPIYQGYMYHWQMCVEGYVCFGRYWKDWIFFMNKLNEIYRLHEKRKLVIYCHNLSYEFHFIYDFLQFTNVFATGARKVLTCKTDCYEFRCSYRLSNMSLGKFLENGFHVKHLKGSGDLDFSKAYLPSTELTPKQLGYCFNDVKGLYERLLELLEDDTLTSIPLTSTGYVRRDCRNAMRKNKKNRKLFKKTKFDIYLYELLKEGFRGGNTASNRYLTNIIHENVQSYDIASSYPYIMMSHLFPIGKFMEYSITSLDELEEMNKKYCTIGRYIFKDIKVKKNIPFPYIPVSKCTNIKKVINYNGRILKADYISITLTNVDYDILCKQYDFTEMYVQDYHFSRKGRLPKELQEVIMEYFYGKSTLKDIEGKTYEYAKSKNRLNAIFGMTVTDILHDELTFTNGEWNEEEIDKEEKLQKYYSSRNNFLCYQWGVWITAYARQRLQEGIDIVGMDGVYIDTDSVKYLGNHVNDFEKLNNDLIRFNKENDILHYVNFNGNIIYMGIWDNEPSYDVFITMGAKKYAYIQNDEIGITVSGLNKETGAKELASKGGISAFKIGTTFLDSGRTTSYFNHSKPHYITIKGETFLTASNIAIVDATYTLGITDTMLGILESLRV